MTMTLTQLDALPYRYLVWSGAEPDLSATEALTAYLSRPGATVPMTWSGAEVVHRNEARRRLASAEGDLYDPWTRTLLPPDEAAAWTSRDLLHAAHWGMDASPPEWKPGRWTEAADLLHDARTDHPAVARLLAAFARQPESVKAAAKERATTAQKVAPVPVASSLGGIDLTDCDLSYRSLTSAIVRTYSADELRRAIRFSRYAYLDAQLPGATASQASVVSDLVQLLERSGLTERLVAVLAAERPALLKRLRGAL